MREALINTLVHADYSDRASIRIQKSPQNYNFRNRTLHQLFLMLRLGERAGSGLPKIRAAWEQLGYQVELHDSFEPYDQTVLTLTKIEQNGGVSGGVNGGVNVLLDFIANNPNMSARALSEKLDIPLRTIERRLKELRNAGNIEFKGPPKTGGYYLK